MSELPNKKKLEEAAVNHYNKRLEGMMPAFINSHTRYINDDFKAGAHYQHPVSYAQGIRDVIDYMRDVQFKCKLDRLPFLGIPEILEEHFSAQLKPLETLNAKQRSGE